MENLQPHQVLVPLTIAIVLGLLVLIWGDRPGLAAALRGMFASADDDDTIEPEPEHRQPPPPARFEVKHFAPYVAPVPAPEPVREIAAPPVREAVLPHVHQVEPSEPAENEPASEPTELTVSAHLSRPDLIALLAVQKNDDGSYRFSSNQITGFVGGTAAEVKKQIAEIREKPAPVAPPAPDASARGKSLRRPAEGW